MVRTASQGGPTTSLTRSALASSVFCCIVHVQHRQMTANALDNPLLLLSEDERSQLRGRSLQEIRSWLEIEARERRCCLADLHSAYNATLAIHRLPIEILVKTLDLVGSEFLTWTEAHWWKVIRRFWVLRIMGVCRHWRSSIVGSPVFWVNISLRSSREFVDLCLARSADKAVTLFRPAYRPSHVDDDCSILVALVAQHHLRIASVVVEGDQPGIADTLTQSFKTFLPSLTSMDLTLSRGAQRSVYPLQFTQGHLPSLRHVRMSGVTLDQWSALPFAQLTSLTISGIRVLDHDLRESCELSFPALLELLGACTSLEELTYNDMVQEEMWAADVNLTVSLSHLRHLRMSGTTTNISKVVAHLSLPPTVQLYLDLRARDTFAILPTEHEHDHLSVLNAALPRDVTKLPVLQNLRHVMAWCTNHRLDVYAVSDITALWKSQLWRISDRRFLPVTYDLDIPPMPSVYMTYPLDYRQLRLSRDVLRGVIAELGDGYLSPAVQTLVICGDAEGVDTHSWIRLLTAFPNLEHLEVVADACSVCALPPALAPSPAGIPCTRLHKLVIRFNPLVRHDVNGRTMFDALHAALRARTAGGCRRLQTLCLVAEPRKPTAWPKWGSAYNAGPYALAVDYRLPDDFQEIKADLESVVDLLTVTVQTHHWDLKVKPFNW
ncbi:uncharacterized protein B0H18DRAFT_307653 [Fomitopsis serialis]|uniref:uncharacterized protein n=1 Tax=Fomitopsis serialis TaxID=139415 RepID=UPI0020088477|nr:uncharacterized protein B0H18DRAFT_307653 [Neoantrodia serialis]KAH9911801.1 hypothetical protein B0H18DRAFT_307653 [Neoantrodia serialis]